MTLVDWLLSKPEIAIAIAGFCIALTTFNSSFKPFSDSANDTAIDPNMIRSTPDSNDATAKEPKKVKFAASTSLRPNLAGTGEAMRLGLKKGEKSFKQYNNSDGDLIARRNTPIEEEMMKKVQNAGQIVEEPHIGIENFVK